MSSCKAWGCQTPPPIKTGASVQLGHNYCKEIIYSSTQLHLHPGSFSAKIPEMCKPWLALYSCPSILFFCAPSKLTLLIKKIISNEEYWWIPRGQAEEKTDTPQCTEFTSHSRQYQPLLPCLFPHIPSLCTCPHAAYRVLSAASMEQLLSGASQSLLFFSREIFCLHICSHSLISF